MKKASKKTNSFVHFKFFKNIVGNHLYGFIVLNLILGLLDGVGLAMFIPLISIATDSNATQTDLGTGNFYFIIEIYEHLGINFNLFNALILILIIFSAKGLLSYIRSVYFAKVRLMGLRKLRLALIKDLKYFTYTGYTKVDSGRVQNSMLGEIGKTISAMTFYFTTIQNLIMVLVYVVLAIYSNWKFSFLVAVGAFVINFVFIYINKITKENARNLSWVGHDFNGNLIQAMHHFKYLKATNLFGKYANKLEDNIRVDERLNFKISKYTGIADAFREPSIILIMSIIIFVQVGILKNNFGSIMISLLLFYRALAYLVVLQSTWNSFLTSSAGIDSVLDLRTIFHANRETEKDRVVDEIQNLELEEVNLEYGAKAHIIHQINLSIPAKKCIAFVGESGAGKTSLVNMICGLIPPTSGRVLVNGQDISMLNINSFRSKVGYITQEPVIFNDDIFNNVTFWDEKTPENLKKFWEVLEMVSLMSFINELPEKENSKLGNNGVLISGGQKQRVSIARELYKEVELLILDEATSALDSETERFIKTQIDTLKGKFTMIIIAHRLATIKDVDEIYLMENGRITDAGDFETLKQKSEKFKKMTELQKV